LRVGILLTSLLVAACTREGDVTIEPLPPTATTPAAEVPRARGELPQGHPTVGGTTTVEDDGHAELPLKKTGLNSREELERALRGTSDGVARSHFELAFRYAFTSRQDRRDYTLAENGFRRALDVDPRFAEAYRGLAYAVFNRGLRFDDAAPLYRKAVDLKPDYGEAHYALAFLLATSDPDAGRRHFKRAMELGVPDERQLGARFYADR
jgi:tetratricopeptide (TPR) repeat protein